MPNFTLNTKLYIPRINDVKYIYVYRSTNQNDIDTISKVSNMLPIAIINQDVAEMEYVDYEGYYTLFDKSPNKTGITYYGPNLNIVPLTEYETDINLIKLSTYTYINELVLTPLKINQKNGIVYYYSIIGVTEDYSHMTHLSKVIGTLYDYADVSQTTRQIFSCDDYNNSLDDVWTLVNTLEYNETDDKISIGDVTRPDNITKLGIPFVETVPKIEYINVSLNSLVSDTFMVLEIQNPWQNNNQEFNFRKLKSYKVRNVYESSYSEFSVPTYQSILPVSIEKMVIMIKENPVNKNAIIDINDENAQKLEIIRRDGIFYEKSKHKSLGYNKWNIPLEENKLSVFSEGSKQETINIQVSAVSGNVYSIDVYLIDVYRNISENTHYVVET